MRRIRRLIYRLGYRPLQGSIFFSPTLAFLYIMRDAGGLKAWVGELNQKEQ